MPRWKSLKALLKAVDAASLPSFPPPVTVNSRRADDDTPLHIVATWGDVEAIEMLVKAGADVNAAGDLDRTPLHVGAGQGHIAAVRALLAAGASPAVRTRYGYTPADCAVGRGSAALVALLGGTTIGDPDKQSE